MLKIASYAIGGWTLGEHALSEEILQCPGSLPLLGCFMPCDVEERPTAACHEVIRTVMKDRGILGRLRPH